MLVHICQALNAVLAFTEKLSFLRRPLESAVNYGSKVNKTETSDFTKRFRKDMRDRWEKGIMGSKLNCRNIIRKPHIVPLNGRN
jgi:hypothetical protein